jgi:hypothetical protein
VVASAGGQLLGAAVGRGVPKLGHGPGLDLAYPLAGQAEMLGDLVEGAGLAPVQAEAQPEDLPLALVEGDEHLVDLVRQKCRGDRGAVLHSVAELGVAVVASGWESDRGWAAWRRISVTLSSSRSRSAASPGMVGRRPSCPSRRPLALVTRVSRSPAWAGTRTV